MKPLNKKFIWIIAIIIVAILVSIGAYAALNQQRPLPPQTITNFEECELAGYPVGESHPRQCWMPDGKRFVEEIEDVPLPDSELMIIVSGRMTCLSKIGQGPQTLECAIGLKGEDGHYYGLRNLSKLDPEYKFSRGGLRVEVSGAFSLEEIRGPDGNKYDVIGVIDVASIKEVRD